MKRVVLVVTLSILCASLPAQLNQPDNEAELGVAFTASVFASFVSPVVSVVHKPEVFGIGGGAKAMIGLGQNDFYVAPYGRIELGALYMGVGPLFVIRQPDDFTGIDSAVSFFSTIGFGIPLDSIANGDLVLDLGVDASITPSPIIVADTGNFLTDLLASIIVTTLGAVMNTVKLNVGLAYAAGF
jgi:hypothetical protein